MGGLSLKMKTKDSIHKSSKEDVQYPFADIGGTSLIHIREITEENRHNYSYTCPYCKKGLQPRLGIKKAHCFAHKPGESCELDKYIHTTAERLLKEKWDCDEPFEITMKVRTECKNIENCFFYRKYDNYCNSEEVKTFDLKKQYSRCLVEKKYGDFIPDLCLIDDTGQHEPIFIEIWSKHKNSEKKALSDNMIVEIRLKTIDDLEELTNHPITESEKVTFAHFKTIKKTPTEKDGPPLIRYMLYTGTHKSFMEFQSTTCTNYKSRHHPKSIFEVVCYQYDIHTRNGFRNLCNAIAIDRGYNIRNCYLCQLYGTESRERFYGYNLYPNRPLGCRRAIETQGLIQCNPEEAMTCQDFKLRTRQLSQIKKQFDNIRRYIWIKNEDGSVTEEYIPQKNNWY